jgi:hypothetical protein
VARMRKARRALRPAEKLKPSRPQFALEFIYTGHPVPYQVAWYKWEFLRRNREYRVDHKQFMDTFGSWFRRRGFWYDHDRREEQWTEADEDHFYDNIAPAIARLCEKWKIGNLYPPKWKFDRKNARRKIGSREIGPPTGIAAELNWDFDVMRELLEMGFTGTADSARRYRNLVLIEFDLDRPMKDLVWYAKYVLTRAMENYKAELEDLGLKAPSGRRRLKDYAVHLTVWDLKQKGKSVSEIAASVFAVEAQYTAIQKVRDHLKAAERLISGGYTGIS